MSRHSVVHLRGRIAGLEPPFVVREFRGGQSNPTYYVSGADLLASPKLQSREGGSGPRDSSSAESHPDHCSRRRTRSNREYQVMTAARGSGVPVPGGDVLLCDDLSVIGTPFFVMVYQPGIQ